MNKLTYLNYKVLLIFQQKKLHHAFLVLLILSTITIIFQAIWNHNSGVVGMYIPDALSYGDHTFPIIRSSDRLVTSLLDHPSPLTLIIYYPFWLISPKLYFVPNTLLLLSSLCTIKSLEIQRTSKSFLYSIITLNPYFYLAIAGPNREIPLTLLTLFFLRYALFEKHTIKAISIIIATYYTRDGYGLLFFIWFIFDSLVSSSIKLRIYKQSVDVNKFYKFLLGLPFFIAVLYPSLGKLLPSVSRNIVAAQGQLSTVAATGVSEFGEHNLEFSLAALENPILAIPALLFRIAANSFSLPVRPALFTSTAKLSILGLSFWIYGFFLASCLVSVFYAILCGLKLSKSGNLQAKIIIKLSFFVTFCVFGISLTPFVQPRYIMPVLPIAALVLKSFSRKSIGLFFFITSLYSLISFSFLKCVGIPILWTSDEHIMPPFFF